jgi:hypothetical protein
MLPREVGAAAAEDDGSVGVERMWSDRRERFLSEIGAEKITGSITGLPQVAVIKRSFVKMSTAWV